MLLLKVAPTLAAALLLLLLWLQLHRLQTERVLTMEASCHSTRLAYRRRLRQERRAVREDLSRVCVRPAHRTCLCMCIAHLGETSVSSLLTDSTLLLAL